MSIINLMTLFPDPRIISLKEKLMNPNDTILHAIADLAGKLDECFGKSGWSTLELKSHFKSVEFTINGSLEASPIEEKLDIKFI